MLARIKLILTWVFDQVILPLLPASDPKTPPGQEDGQ